MGKDKDKKDKDKKKPKKSNTISYYQAITGYKITNTEKELEEVREEFFRLTEKKYQLEQRNQRLSDTLTMNFSKAFDDFRQFKDSLRLQKPCEREEVVTEMKTLWDMKNRQEEEIAADKSAIKVVDREIHAAKKELKKWTDYKETGREYLDTHIRLLKEEMVSMGSNCEVITESLKDRLQKSKDEIDKIADETIKRKQEIAADKAFKGIDEKAIVQTRDNEWMSEKILIFQKELEDLKQEQADLEKENITLMSYLFECSTDDLKCLKFGMGFDDQFLDNENLETNGILNVDLNDLESLRPTSRLAITIEKIKEIEYRNESKAQLAICNESASVTDDRITSDSYMSLGACDYKVLSMTGVRKPLTRLRASANDLTEENNKFNDDDWPVTHEMLRGALRKTVISE